MFASEPVFVKAHSGENSYYNKTLDRETRKVFCDKCLGFIGSQVKYTFQQKFVFEDCHIENYIYCPYCAHEFNKERIFNV